MSIFARRAPRPRVLTKCATSSTVDYVREQRVGSIPSLTLNDRSVMSLHLPGVWPLGMTPNRLTCREGREDDLSNGPRKHRWPSTEGCSIAVPMLVGA